MGQGKYERTPLTQARFKITIVERRMGKLLGKVAEAEHEKRALEAQIAGLLADEALASKHSHK